MPPLLVGKCSAWLRWYLTSVSGPAHDLLAAGADTRDQRLLDLLAAPADGVECLDTLEGGTVRRSDRMSPSV